MPIADPLYASSLANGLSVLEAFGGAPGGLTNKAFVQRTGLSPASVSRITYTLASRGLLRFDPASQCHHLDGAALTLAHPLLVNLGVRRLARLPMKQVSDEVGGTVSLGMHERAHMVYVETSRGNDLVAFRPDVGARLPLLQSAIGRAWLASAAPAERQQAMTALRLAEPEQYRRWSGREMVAIADLKRQGFCVSRGDFHVDVHAVAVPLDVKLDGERLVLNCGIPAHRRPAAFLEDVVGPRLLRLARQIEDEWLVELASGERSLPFMQAVATRRPDDPTDRQFARTLARGIDLLQCFQPGENTLGNGELARRLGLSGPTIARLTHTLTAHGYLRRDAQGARYARYRLGAAAIAVAYPMLSNLKLRERVRPAILALAEKVHGSVSVGMRHQDGMVYIENAWRTDGRVIPPDTGTVMPMLASAMGRAWLSGAEPAERERVFNQIRAHDPQRWSRHALAARQSVESFDRLGFCWSREVRPDVEAFGVPLKQAVDGVRYVLNCGVLAAVPLKKNEVNGIGAALAEVARGIDLLLAT